jgi:hypothetical protein
MGWACTTYEWRREICTGFWWEESEGQNHLKDLGIEVNIKMNHMVVG